MFGSDKKRLERLAEEERRIADAARRERERIEAERAERLSRGQSSLHKFEYLDTKLNEREERRGNKRVEKAQKREAKNIRKEKNRKYWWLLLVCIALIIGCAAGYLVNGHFNHKANYEIATDLIVAKDFEAAEMLLSDLKYKDSQTLEKYLNLRSSMESYNGKLDEYLKALQDLGSFENKDINEQYKDYVNGVKAAGKLQASINDINIDELSLTDKDKIEKLGKQVDKIGNKYKDLLNTKKLDEANIKIAALEEATEQLKNKQTLDEQEAREAEAKSDSITDETEDEFNTDATDAP